MATKRRSSRTTRPDRARAGAARQLALERAALEQRHATLEDLLNRVQSEKHNLARQVMRNVQAVILPMVHAIEEELPPAKRTYTALLAAALAEITSPFAQALAGEFARLTPREIRICDMIRRGLTAKEIAHLEHTATATVNKHREHIRRKLGLTRRGVNLATFLQMRMRTGDRPQSRDA